MRITQSNLLIFMLILSMATACSLSDISGTYKHEKDPSEMLRLTKDKKLIRIRTGDIADYSIDGSKIIVTNPMFGGAEGKIEGNKLNFPRAQGIVAKSLQGTWIKQ